VTASQVALAWLADRPAVTSVILGARTTEQLADNLAARIAHGLPQEFGEALRESIGKLVELLKEVDHRRILRAAASVLDLEGDAESPAHHDR